MCGAEDDPSLSQKEGHCWVHFLRTETGNAPHEPRTSKCKSLMLMKTGSWAGITHK